MISVIIKPFLFFIFLSCAFIGQTQVVELVDEESKLLGEFSSYYVDDSGEITLEQVLSNEVEFIQGDKNVYSRMATPGAIWIRFEVKNVGSTDMWLDLHNSNLTAVSVYKLNTQHVVVDSFNTGALLPRASREKDKNTFWFPLIEKGDPENYEFIIKVKSRIAMELPLYAGNETALHAKGQGDNFMALFFIGSLVVLFIYNIFFFFYLRKRIYLLYSLNVLAFLMVGPFFNNFPLAEYIFGQQMTYNYPNTWIWTTLVTGALFAVEYLELKTVAPNFRKILYGLVIFYLLFVPLSFVSPTPIIVKIYILTTLVFYLTCLFMGYYLLFVKRSKRALLYTIGWTALVVGIVMLVFVRNGLLPYNVYIRNASYFGAFLEALVFAIAVGRHMNELRLKQIKLNKALKDANEDLLNANDSLDSFNYHVSHDLKTVLNNTKALTRMIRKYSEKENPKKLKEVVTKLELVADNGIETVQSFLSLGKVDNLFKTDKIEMLHIETELARILDFHDLTDKMTINIRENSVQSINMHKKAFESIFLNLFTNTIKYSEANPTADLLYKQEAERISFIYKDYGKGIDMEKYGDSIFKPFERGEANEGVEGTGVGLYILHRIVTNYGGQIELESEIGRGILLTIHLPMDLKRMI